LLVIPAQAGIHAVFLNVRAYRRNPGFSPSRDDGLGKLDYLYRFRAFSYFGLFRDLNQIFFCFFRLFSVFRDQSYLIT